MATNEDRGVTSLQDLATDVLFTEIIYKATPSKVESIRDWTDQHLIGKVKKAFREKCVKKLNQIANNQNSLPKHQKDVKDFFAPLNCILDENFVQLAILIPLPISHFFSTIMSIISNHCPYLKELDIGTKFDRVIVEKPEPSIIPNGPNFLHQLTSLALNHLDSNSSQLLVNELNQPVLSIIGKCCPSLVTLKTNGYCITAEDVVGLVLGEWADILFPGKDYDGITGLQVPPEFLNATCFTLQEMHLKNSCRSNCNCFFSSLSNYVAAFSLRHLPKLKVAEFPIVIADVISSLHNIRVGIRAYQAAFENFCKEAASAHPNLARNQFTSPPIVFSGYLALQKVEVSIKDEDALEAVGMRCPDLTHVCFVDSFSSGHFSLLASSSNMMEFSGTVFAANVPPHKLKSILREWPKLNSITLLGVDSKFVKPILDVFGPTLRKLELDFMKEVEMSHLAPCSLLEELTIKRCRNMKASYPANWTWATFLPQLKSIKSECCLENWAPLFERKLSSLIAAQLSCSHIGTDGHNPRLEWSQLPELWPLLESLEVRQCSGLTVDVVSKLIPQLSALRCVKLPRDLFQKDSERATDVQEYFASRNKPVLIEEYDSAADVSQCTFQLRLV